MFLNRKKKKQLSFQSFGKGIIVPFLISSDSSMSNNNIFILALLYLPHGSILNN